ncbi:MAG TPA: nuclear transport factor 2 family protein, partial [Vicinamibacterales bacterium]|nr:nuclear transport factor 2 family protein [Vicinamibacterales bacterium]
MQATSFVRSYFDAWNQMDPQRVVRHMASDAVYWDSVEGVHYSREELLVALIEFFNRYRQHHELIGDILINQDTIAYQYRMTLFDLLPGFGQVSAYHGAEFITVHGESAISITDVYHTPVT